MPQDLGDFRHRCTVADHAGGKAVPKKVCYTTMSWPNASASEGKPHNVVDRARSRQSDAWRHQTEKEPPGDTCPAILSEVERKAFADIREERHMIQPAALAAHENLGRTPLNITELKQHDFTRPQTKAREQKQDCKVAPPALGGEVCGRQHAFHFLRG